MRKENVLIKDGIIEHTTGIYGIYDLIEDSERMLYVGGGDIADCYNRHDSNIKYGHYAGTNKDVIHKLFEDGESLYFKSIELCDEDIVDDRETYWINYYKDSICNGDSKGKRRQSIPTPEETEKRRRANSGESNPNCCKLTEEQVKEIKIYQRDNTYRDRELAKMYNVSLSLINNIRRGERWASVQIEDKKID